MIKSIRRSTTVAALLIAAASVDNVAVNAITAKPSWTVPSPTQPVHEKRGEIDDDTFGDLCVDDEGNLYTPSSSSAAASKVVSTIRGGALCVDGEGNFYSPRLADPQEQTEIRGGCGEGGGHEDTIEEDNKNNRRGLFGRRRRQHDQKEIEESASFFGAAGPISGGYIKSDRLGGLCVDGDGNFFCIPSAFKVPRGGSLSVDDEGNFFSSSDDDDDDESQLRLRLLLHHRRAEAVRKNHQHDKLQKKLNNSRRGHPPHDGR